MKTLFQLAVIAALCLPACAQVALMPSATQVCTEKQVCVVTAVSSKTAVLQFGVGTTWGPTFTTNTFPLSVGYSSPNLILSPYDPAPWVYKVLMAQQQATPYTVAYTLAGVAQPVLTIPALAPTVVATYTGCTINLMSDGTFSSVVGTCKAVTK